MVSTVCTNEACTECRELLNFMFSSELCMVKGKVSDRYFLMSRTGDYCQEHDYPTPEQAILAHMEKENVVVK